MKQLTIIFLALLLPLSLSAQPETDAEATDLVDNFIKEQHRTDHGGATLIIVREGEVVYQSAHGMANLEYGIPNEVNTIFHAASLSKQFTAYAALQLEQAGKLSMNDDVRKYIPEVPDFDHTITLNHLANHMSGLRDQWRLLYMTGWRPDDVILKKDILDLVAQQEDLNFVPGTKVMYSNTGFTLLAEVVARVSGMSFAEYTKAKIFTPLGMMNSQFYDDYQKVVPNRAYSYQEEDSIIKKDRLSFSTVGATSLFTTVNDLSKWAIHLNTLAKTNPAIAKRMNERATLNNGDVTESANGQWNEVKFHGMEWFDHSGSDASYRAYISRFPESNSAAIVLANATSIGASDLALSVGELFLHKHFKEEVEMEENNEATIKAREATYQAIQLSQEQLQQFCGKYWEPEERYDREIKIINDTLVYYRGESSQTKLLPVGENEFKMLGDDNDVSVFFETNEAGESTMRLNINDERTVNFCKYDPTASVSDILGNYFSPELKATINLQSSEEGIRLHQFKRDPILLTVIKKDLFKAPGRSFSKIAFIRDAQGNIDHLLVSNGGALNVLYERL